MGLRWIVFLLCLWSTANAGPVQLQLFPSAAAVTPGDIVTLEAIISGVDRPPSIGSFDIDIGFSPILTFQSATFGPFLGVLGTEALFDSLLLSPTVVNLAEVSLLDPASLDALQPATFTLVTASFLATGTGPVAFKYLRGPIDDAFGDLLFGSKVPEPSSFLLLASGIVAGIFFRRKRS